MVHTSNREALTKLRETFGDRIQTPDKRDPASEKTVGSVKPRNIAEVRILSEISSDYSIPLVPLGAGTVPEPNASKRGLLVRFDLMGGFHLPDVDEAFVGAEPGALWLSLEEELRVQGLGLAVYPTSAPRATVGGWLATDGIGVGSFEFGWMSENVISASVVLAGGELREIPGRDLHSLMYPKGDAAIVVNAKLRTRVANSDAPFAIAFDDVTSLLDALEQAITNRTPLWHLALLNPTMTKIRRLGEGYMLFGAYPGDRSDEVEEVIGRIIKENKGIALSTSMTHRVWTERFFPVAPSRATPKVDRDLMPLSKLASTLSETKNRSDLAIQANVARSNEALLLTLHSES